MKFCPTFFFVLVTMGAAASSLSVEPSQKTKDAYRDLQLQSEQQRKEIKAQKVQARNVLGDKRRDRSLIPFPLEEDDKGKADVMARSRPSVEQEGLLEELESMIHRK